VKSKEELKVIIEGCAQKNRRSQEALFKLFYGKLLPVCMRYMPDKDSAQDVLQIGFIKVFDKIALFDFRGSFEGWIKRIIVNTAIDEIRKKNKNVFSTDVERDFKFEKTNPAEEEELGDFERLKADLAIQAIQQLSPAYRSVFNLYVVEEYTHKEIAEILGISEGTSKSNYSKAKQNLQRILAAKYAKLDDYE
jgi:RNA polymerase sigma-70 factor (ECF subfamily)